MNKKTIEMYFGSALYEAYFSEGVYRNGMGTMILARKTAGGAVVGCSFLCDHYCLGVKDCFAFMENEAGYRTLLGTIQHNEQLTPTTPGTLKAYVTGLVAWAREIGFPPHPDYRFCAKIFNGIVADPAAHYTYGLDGVPNYVNGPNETLPRMQEIVNTLIAYRDRTGKPVHVSLLAPDPFYPLPDISALEQH